MVHITFIFIVMDTLVLAYRCKCMLAAIHWHASLHEEAFAQHASEQCPADYHIVDDYSPLSFKWKSVPVLGTYTEVNFGRKRCEHFCHYYHYRHHQSCDAGT